MDSGPLQVAYIEGVSEMGGAEHRLLAMIDRLPKNSVRPLLVCARDGELANQARFRGIETVAQGLPRFASISRVYANKKYLDPVAIVYNLSLILQAQRQLRRVMQDRKVDIFHTNTMFAHFYGGLAARRTGIPCVWHIPDVIEANRLAGLSRLFWRVAARQLATRIIGTSASAVEVFAGSGMATVIHTGVDVSHQADCVDRKGGWRVHLKLKADSVLIGYVGRIVTAKGLDVLVEAANLVVRAEPRAHFVIIGEALFGEEKHKEALLHQVRHLELETHWHMVGYHSDAAHLLDEFTTLVLPSRRESFPRIALEAGRACKPIVASRVGGIPEIVVPGETGLLVTPNDPEVLADAILYLLKHPNVAREMGMKARQHVEKRFDLDISIAEVLQLYEQVVNNDT